MFKAAFLQALLTGLSKGSCSAAAPSFDPELRNATHGLRTYFSDQGSVDQKAFAPAWGNTPVLQHRGNTSRPLGNTQEAKLSA